MGYRSDVTIAIYGPEDVMVPFIAAERTKQTSPLTSDKADIRHVEKSGHVYLIYEVEAVKWYPHFPEVSAWGTLLSDLFDAHGVEGSPGHPVYEFVRVGESDSDVEMHHGGEVDWVVGLYRSISVGV